jgi:5'-3' exonuclease
MQKRVLFIDLMNMFIRNFSVQTLTNLNGEHVGGYFGTLSSIKAIIDRLDADEVVIAWEGKQSGERRRKTLTSYKEGRKMTGLNRIFENEEEDERESLARQLLLLKETLEFLPVHQIAVQFQEADDIIAWMVNNTFEDYEKIIVSTDKDYFQLVKEDVKVFRPVKIKKKYGQLIDIEHMLSEEGVFPPNHMLLKAVAGCSSDKIDGIPRVGEPTVKKDFPFLGEEKEYEAKDLIEFSKSQKNKKYEKYVENKDLIERNVGLVQLGDVRLTIQDMDYIRYTLENNKPRLNAMKFRLKLLTEDVSPKNASSWTSTFASLQGSN